MAKDKRAVIIYTDLIYTVDEMTDSEAGQFFKHFLAYVNDRNPVAPNRLIKLAFEPIRQQLKRDLAKYERTIEKRKQAGKASAEKRKQQNEQVPTHVESIEQIPTHVEVTKQALIEPVDDEINTKKNPNNHRTQFGITFSDLEPIEYLKKHYQMFFENLIVGKNIPESWLQQFNNDARYKSHTSLSHFQNAFRQHIKNYSNGAHKPNNQQAKTAAIASGNIKNF
jgi:hypothetical protein